MKIGSWNVNGIRSCQRQGLQQWLLQEDFDIVCLQETKAHVEQLSPELTSPQNYLAYFASANKKGYAGVAVYAHHRLGPPLRQQIGIGIDKFDSEGRVLLVEYPEFYLINAYFPNGQRDHARVPFKLEFCAEFTDWCCRLYESTHKEMIICGDFNTAHQAIDLKNPAGNTNTTGFLLPERAWMDQFIQLGFCDIFRQQHPQQEGHYTWWTYRHLCRERNIGWRIDYFFITEGLKYLVQRITHQPHVLGSDHCPVVLELDI